MMKRLPLAVVVVLLALIASAAAQTPPNVQSTVALFQNVRTVANVVYLRANGWEGKLDVYAQRTQTSTPVVIYIHGGGWVRGSKDGSVLSALPYLAMGYSVVNVEYRLADVSLAPAAIEDCRCALRWVVGHAKDYNFDVGRIVIAGASPLTYVRAGVPPTIAIHGDADPLVPYAHSTRLNDALQKAGVAHELVTVPGGGHGNFSLDQWQRAYTAIEKFLGTHVTASKSTAGSGN